MQLRLRAIIIATFAIGIAATLPDRRLLLFMAPLFVPAGWVYWRPRPGQIAFWAMWAVPVAMLAVVARIDRLQLTWGSALAALVTTSIVVVLPVVRSGYKPPALPREGKLPPARVVRR